jgi:hypothetical protein
MDLPSERNRAANKDGPLLIGWMILISLMEVKSFIIIATLIQQYKEISIILLPFSFKF